MKNFIYQDLKVFIFVEDSDKYNYYSSLQLTEMKMNNNFLEVTFAILIAFAMRLFIFPNTSKEETRDVHQREPKETVQPQQQKAQSQTIATTGGASISAKKERE